MVRHQVVSVLLVALLALTFHNVTISETEDESEPMSISLSSAVETLSVSEEDALLSSFCEKFNVEFTFLSTSTSDASEVYRLLAALNDLPDILTYDARWDFSYFLQCGALSPVPNTLYAYPNIAALNTYPYASALQQDGCLWGIPCFPYDTYSGMVDTCAVFYKDIYDAAWPYDDPPDTLEDWHFLLSQIQQQNPQMIPLTSRSAQAMFNLTYFYSPATYTWVWDDTRYIPGYYSDAFAESIEALKVLWDDGLLDADFMNENVGTPSGLDKFMLGSAAGILYSISPTLWQSEFAPIWSEVYPEETLSSALQIVFLPSDANGNYYETYTYNVTSVFFGSSVSDEKMTRILTMLDWLCSDEGLSMRRYGLPDVDYHINEKGEIERISTVAQLNAKYPSYAFLRTFPNQDVYSFQNSMCSDPETDFVLKQYNAWREHANVQTLFLTNLRANTISTQAVINFNPNIEGNAFRMLNSNSVSSEFSIIKREYSEAGIQQMIDSVHYAIQPFKR